MIRDSNLFKSRHTKLKVVTSMGFQNVIEKKSKLENKKQVLFLRTTFEIHDFINYLI